MADPEFILSNPSVTIATELIMFIICIVGLFFNGLAVYITLFRHRSKNAAIWLMIYIAAVDIMFSIHYIASQIAKWATLHQVMLNPWFCQYTGMFFTLLIMSSTDGVGLLSLLRVLSIARDTEIRAVYWYITIGLLTTFNTAFSIIAANNGIMRLMPSETVCQAQFRKNTFSIIYSLFMMVKYSIMLLIILISYFWITIKFYQTASRLNSKNNDSNGHFIENTRAKSYQRLVIMRLLILVIMYMICFLPELLVIVYNLITETERSPITDGVVAIGVALTIIVNSVFLLFYNQENRKILAAMIPSWMCLYSDSLEIQELSSF
ncbi:family A G protein-coupled receptor-like protein [Conidiobolus coronatus NRRL 28638]|uniref:Family A G protein-coupled receptor-like protein n=1 Tax=Conidiobolus coronatus (strain ATCC 28846 / CBS 209.66 / NRRL 28638) TaxID=796925 RepID=A0A137PHP3_CONC2|nr:family A G protein-coupled receptor-like protein [Conidiobolus coronatus NRRL 28638]|eukprot:KXN74517.1 family A G protein-coupled receptor-like protein [Conidiobolus coronatus NRRL 28638]